MGPLHPWAPIDYAPLNPGLKFSFQKEKYFTQH